MIISKVTKQEGELEGKLMGFGYDLLVPFFFIIVGANVNLRALTHNIKDLTIFVGIERVYILTLSPYSMLLFSLISVLLGPSTGIAY